MMKNRTLGGMSILAAAATLALGGYNPHTRRTGSCRC